MKRDRAAAAFTLVELLVVIGIIAVLVGILLPSLNKAREHAKTVQCLSNLKQIAMAALSYSAINKGVVVPANYDNGALDNTQTRDFWAHILISSGHLPKSLLLDTANPDPFNSVLYCPSTRQGGSPPAYPMDFAKSWQSPVLEPGKFASFSYGMNANSRLDRQPPCIPIPCPKAGNAADTVIEFRKMGRIRRPADMAFFFDGYGVEVSRWNSARQDLEAIDARHEKRTKTNIVFFDGHADTFVRKTQLPLLRNDFASSNTLSANYPAVKWRIDQ
jgi:prepilin-type processing-associated H-X9-DG protein